MMNLCWTSQALEWLQQNYWEAQADMLVRASRSAVDAIKKLTSLLNQPLTEDVIKREEHHSYAHSIK